VFEGTVYFYISDIVLRDIKRIFRRKKEERSSGFIWVAIPSNSGDILSGGFIARLL